jgi:hypothetical protein
MGKRDLHLEVNIQRIFYTLTMLLGFQRLLSQESSISKPEAQMYMNYNICDQFSKIKTTDKLIIRAITHWRLVSGEELPELSPSVAIFIEVIMVSSRSVAEQLAPTN